jgi:hypothetical protein
LQEFANDLLEVIGGGRARDFETARDLAITRILPSESIRRTADRDGVDEDSQPHPAAFGWP